MNFNINKANATNQQIKLNSQCCELQAFSLLIDDHLNSLLSSSNAQTQEHEWVNLEKIYFTQSTYYIDKNEMLDVHIVFYPENTSCKDVAYTSSDPTVFTVLATGVIIGHKQGEATLTAVSPINNDIKATARVIVSEKSYAYTLGQLFNVDDNADYAPDGSLLVKNGDKYVVNNYTDTIVLDIDASASDLWKTIVDNDPSQFLINKSDWMEPYPAEIERSNSKIRIKFAVELRNYILDLTKIDNVVYRSIYYSEYIE